MKQSALLFLEEFFAKREECAAALSRFADCERKYRVSEQKAWAIVKKTDGFGNPLPNPQILGNVNAMLADLYAELLVCKGAYELAVEDVRVARAAAEAEL